MKTLHKIIIFLLVILGFFGAYYFYNQRAQGSTSGIQIRDFDYAKDHQAVDDMFHKGDNMYWMVSTEGAHPGYSYSIDFMLRNKTSSQVERRNDMILKVATVDGQVAGFLAYYPVSQKVWKILFVLVDQDFRRKGIAKKITMYGVHDSIRRGALKVELGTRNNNFKAQGLYKSLGFKFTGEDPSTRFVHFVWYK